MIDYSTFIAQKNEEYLEKLRTDELSIKGLKDKEADLRNERANICDDFDAREKQLNIELYDALNAIDEEESFKVNNASSSINEEILRNKNSIKNKEESATNEYNDSMNELETMHKNNMARIKLAHQVMLENAKKEYDSEIFGIENGKLANKEMNIFYTNEAIKETNSLIMEKMNEKNRIEKQIEEEINKHRDNLIDVTKDIEEEIQELQYNESLLNVTRRYYDVKNEIDELKNRNNKVVESESTATYQKRKAEAKERYANAQNDANNYYQNEIEREKANYNSSKLNIITNKDQSLQFLDEDKRRGSSFIDKLKDVVEQINNDAEYRRTQVKDDINNKLKAMSRNKDNDIARIDAEIEKISEFIKVKNVQQDEQMQTFLNETKEVIDELIDNVSDCSIGRNDFYNVTKLPDQICIGNRHIKFGETPLITKLYGNEELFTNARIDIDMRKCGNIIINASGLDERNEVLYRTVYGLTMKYMEEFPLGSMKVHWVEMRHDVWLDKFINSFARMSEPRCRSLITYNSDPMEIIDKVERTDIEQIGSKLRKEIKDMYDLYKIDQTQSFHLFVIRSGFADIALRRDELTLLETLMGERGRISGVRFIIVNDFDADDEGKDPIRDKRLRSILNSSVQFDFKDNKLYQFGEEVETSYIDAEDVSSYIENHCDDMANYLARKASDIVTYEDIGFNTIMPVHENFSALTVPVGKFGSDVMNIMLNCGGDIGGSFVDNTGYMVIGRTSTGKSSFYHNLIINGCMKYSPDDLQFWLLDFKNGGASSNYERANLPHIKLLSKDNKIDDAYCLFKLILQEMDRRMSIYNSVCDGGSNVANISAYNKYIDEHPNEGKHMNRIVVAIDEAQEMFTDDSDDDSVSKIKLMIAQIARRSRSVGIHMVMIAQNLTGKAIALKEAFVNHIKGKVSFAVENGLALDLSNEFRAVSDEMPLLRRGEAYMTNGMDNLAKVKMAYCSNEEFSKYFEQIRDRYSDYESNMILIGEKSPLYSSQYTYDKAYRYIDLIRAPKTIVAQKRKIYDIVFGENAYSMQPITFTLDSGVSSICVLGQDDIVRSSLCTTMLNAFVNIGEGKVYVCNGAGIMENIFNKAINDNNDKVTRYPSGDIDKLIKVIYKEYMHRKLNEENDNVIENEPVFVIINDMTLISKIQSNIEIDFSKDQGEERKPVEHAKIDCDIVDINKWMKEENIRKKFIQETASNKTKISKLIVELCNNGAHFGIYVNFSAPNLSATGSIREYDDIRKNSSNVLICNSYTGELMGVNGHLYIVKKMLASINNNVKDGQTRAVAILNKEPIKVRPVLYKVEE